MKRYYPSALLVAILLPFIMGCNDSSDSSTSILSVIPEENYFQLTASSPDGGYNLERTYQWRCTSGRAEVVIDALPETVGTVHIVMLDSIGQTVYESTYNNLDACFSRDLTLQGFSGMWSTQIVIVDFKGCASITASSR